MNYAIAQETRIGGREINQDRVAWLATADAVMMVVADGMGGHLQGEVAAQIAVDTFCERFRSEATTLLPDPARFSPRHSTRCTTPSSAIPPLAAFRPMPRRARRASPAWCKTARPPGRMPAIRGCT
jgi:hypothetical protein